MFTLTDLLRPFLILPLSAEQGTKVATYLGLLLKWNAKISLTALRDPEQIVQRHFGESFLAAERAGVAEASSLVDVGSGAGFPGLPMAIYAPATRVTLIESQQKKVAFLREVVRALELKNVTVHAGRAQEVKLKSQMATMRAVEKFETILPVAASLLEPGGKLALLIGASQIETAHKRLQNFTWMNPISVPESRERIVLVGKDSAESPHAFRD